MNITRSNANSKHTRKKQRSLNYFFFLNKIKFNCRTVEKLGSVLIAVEDKYSVKFYVVSCIINKCWL